MKAKVLSVCSNSLNRISSTYNDDFYSNVRMKPVIQFILVVVIFLSAAVGTLQGQYQMENLNRGIVAVSTSDTSVFISWRMLGTDPETISFNVYRDDVRINDLPVTNSTNFVDMNGSPANRYHVVPVLGGTEQESSDTVSPWAQNYITIPLQRPAGGTTPSGSYSNSPNDASVADLDGDGEYEIVLKWDPSNLKDNLQIIDFF